MVATITTSPITVEFYAGNLFCGLTEAQLEGISIEKSIADYQHRVQEALPEYEIAWKTHDGEGPAERVYAEDDSLDIDSIQEDVMRASEKIFNDGHFWTNN